MTNFNYLEQYILSEAKWIAEQNQFDCCAHIQEDEIKIIFQTKTEIIYGVDVVFNFKDFEMLGGDRGARAFIVDELNQAAYELDEYRTKYLVEKMKQEDPDDWVLKHFG